MLEALFILTLACIWAYRELRDAPMMPDCYGEHGCCGDCETCQNMEGSAC